MVSVGLRCVLAAGAGVLGLATLAARADDFYAGKTIDVIVSSGEGGVNDLYARIMADHLPWHLPGKPMMIARNMPGAGGLRAVQFLWSNASKDGLSFGVVQRSAAVQPLLGVENANYDPSRFNWIGSTARETSIGAVWTASTDIRTLEDAKTRELIVGSSGVGNDTGGFPLVLNYFLGTKFKPVHGYKSGSEIILAMQRGEVQGRIGWSWGSVKSSKTADWIREGKIKLLMQMGISKAPDLPDVPLVGDLARNELDRQAMELVFAATTIGWPSVMPPGVPADRIAAMRAAYDATMKDPEFIRNAQKAKLELDPLTGKQIDDIVGHLMSFSPEVAARAKASLAVN
jgi:tripartite-type tricarboxylate transporter receptor subunit TctC